MEMRTMKYPFEVSFAELEENLDGYVSAVFSTLESEFLILPRGEGFVDYPVFEQAYEVLKQATESRSLIHPVCCL